MKCSEIKELLSAYANDELLLTQKEFVEDHLAGCIDCRATLADFRVIRERIVSLKAIPVMPDTKEITLQKVKALSIRKSTFKWVRPSLAAIPIAAIMITLFVLQPWSPANGPTTVMAMDQLVQRVTYATAADLVHSCRAIVSDSVSIDSNGNIQFLSDVYDFEITAPFLSTHLTIKDVQTGKTNEFIYDVNLNGCTEYYLASNSISVDYITAMNKSGGIPGKSKTLTFLQYLTSTQQLPDEIIDGVECLHYKGISGGQFGTAGGVPIEFWIGKDDFVIRQITQQLPEQAGTGLISIRKYYDFNAPIIIQAPIAASGDLLVGWQTQAGVEDTSSLKLLLSKDWVVANDTCPSPYYALVTFPTSWLTDSPFSPGKGIWEVG